MQVEQGAAALAGAGTVTAASLEVGGRWVLELVVYPAVLRQMPWYRGGADVSVTVGLGLAGETLWVMRGGPLRLRARVSEAVAPALEKLPPVVLRIPDMPQLRPGVRPPQPVAFAPSLRRLDVTLPDWAHRTQPRPSYSPVLAGGAR